MKITSIDKVNLLQTHIDMLENVGELSLFKNSPKNEKEISKRIKETDILLVNLFEISKNVLDFAKNLKMIIVFGTGFNNIDLKEAKKRNILICNVPDYCTEAVAEHTVGLILNTVRLASVAESNLRKGEWNPHKYKGFELKGKTLGIIGYGNIGKRVGEIAKRGFGMKINYINSQSDKTNLNFLLKESDILSINSSLNKKTLGMLNKKEFSLMKNKVVIVNTGRFLVLNKKELIRNLKSGKIFGVGLDVFDKEPISMNDPLLKINNVVLTPHLSFKTEESEFRISEIVMNTIISFIKNKPINVVK